MKPIHKRIGKPLFLYLPIFLLPAILIVNLYSAYAGTHDYRQHMRQFIIDISNYGKGHNPDLIVIPQNGHELMSTGVDAEGPPALAYIEAIDGAGQEDLFYGYKSDNRATALRETAYLSGYLDLAKAHGIAVLVTDYCRSPGKADISYEKNNAKGYVSFAAPERELNVIPEYPRPIRNVNNLDIDSLQDVHNFLYLINPGAWENRDRFINDLQGTDYDLLIVDLFFEDEEARSIPLKREEVASLKRKPNGGNRLVVCYMSIGEAEDYRYYWQNTWEKAPPHWLEEENPNWPGNYKVRYWDSGWRDIIMGDADSYLDRIINAGFDGVYLDLISTFEYFEVQEH